MKVAINTSYGGFGLSVEALKCLYKKESELLKNYTPWDGIEWYDMGDGFYGSRRYDFIKKDEQVYTFEDENRMHPDLIALIETLGDKANGLFSELKIVEIPDGIEFSIEEYDGREEIHEKHRSWK